MMKNDAVYPSLRGKRVVVTGGGSGIGAGLVEAFVGQGAVVHFLDILVAEARALADSFGNANPPPKFHACDLKSPDEIAATFEKIGPVEILINNAANDDRHAFEDVTAAYFDERIAVNLRHMLLCARQVVPGMRKAGGGAIVNLGSISWHLGQPQLSVYETAKAGIEGMTRALARELGPDRIRVTCIVPGNVKTPRQSLWYTPEDEAKLLTMQCLPIRIEPRDVAALALFLASDNARCCTGHNYWVDAGWR
jgi:NAD(P)-dependent dehydrogenase (short-subunit alcohol dehydrogenase family)